MAKYANPGNSGEDEMYADAGGAGGEESQASDHDESQEPEKTYLLPKEVLMGKKFEPGDEVVLRIVGMHDDQIEVTYAPAKEQEKSPEGEGAPEPEGAMAGGGGEPGGGMSSMSEYE